MNQRIANLQARLARLERQAFDDMDDTYINSYTDRVNTQIEDLLSSAISKAEGNLKIYERHARNGDVSQDSIRELKRAIAVLKKAAGSTNKTLNSIEFMGRF